jgi:hypothetical protein
MCVRADACIGKVAALTLVGQVKDSLSPLSVMIFGNRKVGPSSQRSRCLAGDSLTGRSHSSRRVLPTLTY